MDEHDLDPKAASAFGQPFVSGGVSVTALMGNYWPNLVGGCLLVLATNLIIVALPMLINAGISLIENGTPTPLAFFSWNLAFQDVAQVVACIIALSIGVAIIRTLSRIVIFDVGRSIERDVRALVFNHVSTLDDDFFARHSVGDIMNHLTSDVTNIRMITGFAVLNIINMLIMFVFTVPLLLRIDYFLALCALVPFPLVMLATGALSRKMFETTRYYQEELSAMVNHVQENLLGAHVVRLFHQQIAEGARFWVTNQKTYKAAIKLSFVRVLMFPLMRLAIGLAVGLILFAGGQAIVSGRISLGDFVEINARILQLTWPAMSIGFVWSVYSRGQASIARINQLIGQVPFIVDGPDTLGTLNELKVVELKLNDRVLDASQAVSFSLKKGELLGIVGASGSYKSSLLRSLYRRRAVVDGTVFFDHHDLNNLTLNSLYGQIAVVSQEPSLFHQSIRDNICFARPEASDEEVTEVLEITRLDEDLSHAAQGLDTVVGERGITLSGGQRQRVALARALLAKRPLVILDDALSAVDSHTEQHIISQLKSYLKHSLVIIATHRLAALKEANEILVLDQGQILARGRHEQLLKSCALYRELWGQRHE